MAAIRLQGAWRAATRDASAFQSIAALVVLSIAFLTATAIWTARQSNELAVDRQIRLARNGIDQELENATAALQAAAVSDEAWRRLHVRFEQDFAENRLPDRIGRPSPDTLTLLVAPQRATLVAIANGQRTDPRDGQVTTAAADTAGLADLVRQRFADAQRRAGGPDDPDQLAGRFIREASLMRVAGRPAIVAVAPVMPETAKQPRKAGPPTVLVAIEFFGPTLLDRVARVYMLPDLQYVATDAVGPELASVAVMAGSGEMLGRLAWTPHQPGNQMVRHLVPLLLVAAALFVAFAMLVVIKFNTRSRQLAESEARATHAALHDPLSGLANRVLLSRRMDEALAEARQDQKPVAIVYVDLDRFKDVNDTLGHQAGDEVIRETAKRLAAIARPGDTAARISGDEFALIVRSAPDRDEIERRLGMIVSEIARPIAIGERTVYPGGSVGCAIAPDDGVDRSDLQHKADLALYRAKSGGRGRFLVYSSDMDDGHRKRTALRQDLRAAIAENRLTVLYQPFFSTADMRCVGVEARVAWDHPVRGRIPAGEFIPVAEDSGLIREIGAWILRRAARDAHRWPDVSVAINVSPIEIRQPTFASSVLAIVEDEGLDPHRLTVDLTENVLLADADTAVSVIERLRSAGVRIALDEFGSGQSSFNYLSRFRFDLIKIDRSFVAQLETSEEVATIVQSMVELAKKLGLETAAEGVETFGQFRFVQAVGCSTVQGHLCARPMPAADVSRFLEKPLSERLKIVA
jgi:diguanylate cyclase (GGDEF)-like protein